MPRITVIFHEHIGGHLPILLLNSNDSDSKLIDAVSCHQQKIKQSASTSAIKFYFFVIFMDQKHIAKTYKTLVFTKRNEVVVTKLDYFFPFSNLFSLSFN